MAHYRIEAADRNTGDGVVLYAESPSEEQARELAYSRGLLVSSSKAHERPRFADSSIAYAVERGVFRALVKFTIIIVVVQILLGLLAWRILASEGVI